MNENNTPSEYRVVTMVDGEMVPVTVGAPINGDRLFGASPLTPFVNFLTAIQPEMVLAMNRAGTTWIRFNKHFSRIINEFLIYRAGMIFPKWLYYYRHGRCGKTRRKYRKRLIRLAWKELESVNG